jgi:flagellar assembly protein FliH
MGLIKSDKTPQSLGAFSMKDIEGQAKSILARAGEQAEQLLAQAQAEANRLRHDAHTLGMSEGRRKGQTEGLEAGKKSGHDQSLAEARPKLAELTRSLENVLGQIESHRRELASAAVQDVIELAVAIARRVTKRLGEVDASVVEANVTEAMKMVVHASDVRIAIHPGQRKTMEDVLPRLKMQWPKLDHVALIDDATLAPGGCRIFTAHGQVDGDLDEQLERVVADLLPREKKEDGI